MTSGTKVLLAVIGLFVGVLIAYYGFFLSPEAPPTAAMSDPALEAPVASKPAARPAERGLTRAPGTTPDRRADRAPERTPRRDAVTMGRPSPATTKTATQRPAARTVVPLAQPASADRTGRGEAGTTAARPPSAPAARTLPVAPTPVSGPVRTDGRTSGPAANRPAVAVPTPSAPPRTIEYRVRAGDTMSHIAESWFGDETLWDLIAKENPSVDPMRLKIGQALRLPPRDAARDDSPRAETRGPGTSAASPTEHVVRAGETLSSIAARYLGGETEWRRLFEANRGVIGSDPDRLEVGMRLRIPR